MSTSIDHGDLVGVDIGPTLPVEDLGAGAEAVHAGVLAGSELIAEYTLRQPAPRQWVAIGVVTSSAAGQAPAPRMLVGRGATRAACLGNLARRVAALARRRDSEGHPG